MATSKKKTKHTSRRKKKTYRSKNKSSKTNTAKTKTKTVKEKVYHYETNMQDTNILSDGWVQVEVQKIGSKWKAKVNTVDNDGNIQESGSNAIHVTLDSSNFGDNYNTALSTIAVGMFKHSIMEDVVNPPEIYKNIHQSLTMMKVYRHNPEYEKLQEPVPDVVAKGQTVEFDTSKHSVRIGGYSAKPTWSTDWPSLNPGVNHIKLVGVDSKGKTIDLDDADVVIQFNPRLL